LSASSVPLRMAEPDHHPPRENHLWVRRQTPTNHWRPTTEPRRRVVAGKMCPDTKPAQGILGPQPRPRSVEWSVQSRTSSFFSSGPAALSSRSRSVSSRPGLFSPSCFFLHFSFFLFLFFSFLPFFIFLLFSSFLFFLCFFLSPRFSRY